MMFIAVMLLIICTISAIYCTFCDLKDRHYWQALGSCVAGVITGACAIWLAGMI